MNNYDVLFLFGNIYFERINLEAIVAIQLHIIAFFPFKLKTILNTFPRRFLLPAQRHQQA
jgi:hypothetical protein